MSQTHLLPAQLLAAQPRIFKEELVVASRKAQTLAAPIEISGLGLHTGGAVQMRFLPAPQGWGIRFRRVDLPNQPYIFAQYSSIRSTHRATVLYGQGASVHTVEHVLAALYAYQIDNLTIELSEAEPPVAGGCSTSFVEMISKVGGIEQEEQIPIFRLDQPIYYSEGDIHIVALPSPEYRISYTLHYPNLSAPALRSQFFTSIINEVTFTQEIAPCRSFALYEELEPLLQAGLIRGTSLSSGLVIKDGAIISMDGLRFYDEMARHKVLDMIGDLSLLGLQLRAHIIAIRAGHTANAAFVEKLYHYLTMEKSHD